jgi:hypothetical protein
MEEPPIEKSGERDLESELLLVRAHIEAAPPEDFLEHTDPLREEDFALIGKYIQCYCYADFNGRRIIDTIRGAEEGAQRQNAGRLADAQVFSSLKEAAARLAPCAMV